MEMGYEFRWKYMIRRNDATNLFCTDSDEAVRSYSLYPGYK